MPALIAGIAAERRLTGCSTYAPGLVRSRNAMRSLHFVGGFPHLFPLTRTANLVETDVTVR